MEGIVGRRPSGQRWTTPNPFHSLPPLFAFLVVQPLIPLLTPVVVALITPAEDSLNISLRDVTATGRDGRVSQLDQVYIRGSMCRTSSPTQPSFFSWMCSRWARGELTLSRGSCDGTKTGFFIVPDMLANAPMYVSSLLLLPFLSCLADSPSLPSRLLPILETQVQASRTERHEGTRNRNSARKGDHHARCVPPFLPPSFLLPLLPSAVLVGLSS